MANSGCRRRCGHRGKLSRAVGLTPSDAASPAPLPVVANYLQSRSPAGHRGLTPVAAFSPKGSALVSIDPAGGPQKAPGKKMPLVKGWRELEERLPAAT